MTKCKCLQGFRWRSNVWSRSVHLCKISTICTNFCMFDSWNLYNEKNISPFFSVTKVYVLNLCKQDLTHARSWNLSDFYVGEIFFSWVFLGLQSFHLRLLPWENLIESPSWKKNKLIIFSYEIGRQFFPPFKSLSLWMDV
jgi:hypothetical protein